MDIKLRKATLEDFPAITLIGREILQLHVSHRPDMYRQVDEPRSYEDYRNFIENDRDDVVVAVVNDHIVGQIIYKIIEVKDNPMIVETRYMYIEEICVKQGLKHQGIGKCLFEHCRQIAKDMNLDSIQLVVWAFNEPAIKFYESLGMTLRTQKMEVSL